MLVLAAIALVVSLAAGAAAGGRLRNLGELRLEAVPLAFGGLVVMVVTPYLGLGSAADRALIGAGYLMTAAFVVCNLPGRRGALRAGILLLGLGWVLNATVIGLNGAMPLSSWAYRASGQTEAITPGTGGFVKIEVAREGTLLRPLGDVIPLRPFGQVVSIGDLVLVAGLAAAVAGGMRTRPGLGLIGKTAPVQLGVTRLTPSSRPSRV